jgi:hypothetical protein
VPAAAIGRLCVTRVSICLGHEIGSSEGAFGIRRTTAADKRAAAPARHPRLARLFEGLRSEPRAAAAEGSALPKPPGTEGTRWPAREPRHLVNQMANHAEMRD